jgi:FAD/FMN-containing dehydrogenase
MTDMTETLVAELQELVGDSVITPGSPEYDLARQLPFGGAERRPAAIVRVRTADEAAATIRKVRGAGADLAVLAGGHSLARHSINDGGIVLDLSGMKAIEIDADARTAWAEAGLTAREFTVAAGEQGLAVGFGDTGTVGIAGLTLGGGLGFLTRLHGLTIDSLLAVELVTADGDILTVDADTHPELFWAIRGGGGNFGVVTRLQYRLHELPGIVGGMLVLPATAEVIASVIERAKAAPEELTMLVNVTVAPPLPFLPEEVHGSLIAMVQLCYAGRGAEAEAAIAPFRSIATPLVDLVRPSDYVELFPEVEPPFRPMIAARTMFLDAVGRDAAQFIIDRILASTAMMKVVNLRVLGGAVARVAADATAYAHRDRLIMANATALHLDPSEAPTHEAWVAEVAAGLRDGDAASYVNFVAGGAQPVRDSYPGATWDRLREIKRRYDPSNFFRGNQNIPPAEA